MLKSVLIWQSQFKKLQIIASGTIVIVCLFAIFYLSVTRNESSWHIPSLTNAIQTTSTSPSPTPLSTGPMTSYDPKKLAFLVETRPLPHLPALFTHMVAIIPPEWTFRFMGSPVAIAHMRSVPTISRLEASGKLTIVPLPSNYSLHDRESISQMFTDPLLYTTHLAPAEHLLVFQPDSIFCANAPRTLNDYLQYDWIGAPWAGDAQFGGNGGLSLRRISAILRVLQSEQRKPNDGELEDLWLCNRMHRMPGAKMANASISKTFSVEGVWDDAPLGYHVGWLGVHHGQLWDSEAQVEHVLEYCPEVKMILGMRLAGDKPKSVQKVEQEGSVAEGDDAEGDPTDGDIAKGDAVDAKR